MTSPPTHNPSDRRIQTVCLLVLAAVVGGFALKWLAPVLVPFTLALFFAYGLAPVVDAQVRRLRVPRGVALVSTGILGVALFLLVVSVVSSSVGSLEDNGDRYQQAYETAKQSVKAQLGKFGIKVPGADESIPSSKIGEWAAMILNAVKGLLSNAIVVLIFMLFLLVGGSGGHAPPGSIWREVEQKVQRYISVKVLLSGITSILVYVVLRLLGVDLAIVFGLLTFLLNFIPNVGSVLAVAAPLPIVIVAPEMSFAAKCLAIAIPFAIQFTVGNVVEPRMLGNSFDLHPITVLLALMFWSMLWGIVGMFLSVPITAVLKILLERLELTAPIAHLMAGRLGSRGDGGEAA